MFKLAKIAMLSLVVLAVTAAALPAFAQDKGSTPAGAAAPETKGPATTQYWLLAGSAAGSGLVILGAGYGIGKIGSSAVESMARQPEVAGNIQVAMIIAAALIEGVTFFALIVCLLSIIFKY